MSSRHRGPNATGGTSKPLRREYDYRVSPEPNPAHIALLRACLAKRFALTTQEAQAFAEMLGEAVKRPLSEGARTWVERVAFRIGAEAAPVELRPAMSFGPLPLKPPGRAA